MTNPVVSSLAALAVVCAAVSAGCSSNNSTPTTPTSSGPTTEIFTSIIYPGNVISHTFQALAGGQVTVTLTNAGPPSNVVLGLGIGVPDPNGSDCKLTTAVNTSAGPAPQISVNVDTGAYCVALFDTGNVVPAGEAFSLTIVHP